MVFINMEAGKVQIKTPVNSNAMGKVAMAGSPASATPTRAADAMSIEFADIISA
jgi:hypothetical protein